MDPSQFDAVARAWVRSAPRRRILRLLGGGLGAGGLALVAPSATAKKRPDGKPCRADGQCASGSCQAGTCAGLRDCPDGTVQCCWPQSVGDADLVCDPAHRFGSFGPFGFCFYLTYLDCRPCHHPSGDHWQEQCNRTFADCDGRCLGFFEH